MADILPILLKTIKEAGAIAKSGQEGIAATSKKDKTPVTSVDIKVSSFIGDAIKAFTKDMGYLVIDEELEQNPAEQWEAFQNTEFSCFIDPISGTLSYMNGLPFYGISIGVLRYGQPYIGAVYLPAFDELYWHEGGSAFFQSPNCGVKTLNKFDHNVGSFSLFFINLHQRFTLSESIGKTVSFPAVNPGLLWSATGKFTGALVKLKVWDMAAAWGICQAVGLDFYTLDEGKKVDRVSEDNFDKNWKMCQPMIMTSASNIDVLRANIKPVV